MGVDLSRLFAEKLAGYADAGYLTWDGDTVTLTQDGVFFGNNIISELNGCITDRNR